MIALLLVKFPSGLLSVISAVYLFFNVSVIKTACYHHFTGLHVVVTMFTGYLIGYAAFRALFSHSPAMVTFANDHISLFILQW